MNIIGWFSKQRLCPATARLFAGCVGVAILLLMTGIAFAQDPAAAVPAPGAPVSAPNGYTIHQSIDAGGRFSDQQGSGAMYDTLVNEKTGLRVQGETFELRAVPGNKNPVVDELKAFSNGFGGDPINFAKLDFSKSKYYEFSSTFRRDRRYFDYDLLGNPGIPYGYSIPVSGSATPYAWPQVTQSPFMYNTVRRMTDVNLTLLPLSKVTFRIAYSKNIFQGPSTSPSGDAVAGQELILEEYQRNSTDDYTFAVDWKPVQGTKLTYEEQIDRYKGDSYFTMAPQYYTVQESDGTKVALLTSYMNFLPYGYSATTGVFTPGGNGCNTTSMISATTALYANPAGGLPIIDPACNVVSSYLRSQPTRVNFPTEIFRLQSSSIKHLEMNGDLRYTNAKMNVPNYYESFQGLDGADRSISFAGNANAQREVVAIDYGIVWQAGKTVSIEDQITYSNAHQPGTANATSGTTVTVPTTAGQETINYTGLTSCTTLNSTTNSPAGCKPSTSFATGGPAIGGTQAGYFGQRFLTNDATVNWDMTPRTTFSLTYRYQDHLISEGQGTAAHNIPIPITGSADTTSGTVEIHENGGIVAVALRPATNWDINGSFEAMYNDSAFTPMGFRQLRHYRMHTIYRVKSWATVSGAFNDLERHNNTNNQQNLPGNPQTYFGQLKHEDHSRVVSMATELFPNDHYGLDLSYSYNDVYMADNGCFQGAATVMPGATNVPGIATPTGSLCGAVSAGHGSNTVLAGPAKNFQDAPTQFGSASVSLSPNTKLHSNIGYRISSVNGSRFFTDPMDVNGSIVSNYQTPFLNVAYTLHPGLIWKAEYNYTGYTEGGGHSGAQYCMNNPALAVGSTSETPVACSTVANTAMNPATPIYGFTAPRDFHANNIVLGMHWEF